MKVYMVYFIPRSDRSPLFFTKVYIYIYKYVHKYVPKRTYYKISNALRGIYIHTYVKYVWACFSETFAKLACRHKIKGGHKCNNGDKRWIRQKDLYEEFFS